MRSSSRPLIAGIVAVATAAALASCAPPSENASSTSLTVAVRGFSVDFDPIRQDNGRALLGINQAVYEPLFAVDRSTGAVEPWLAEQYEVSDDGLLLNVKLREDVDFTDGTHLDAEGLKYFFDTIFAAEFPKGDQGIGSAYEPVVTVTGEYALEIATTRPMRSAFFGALSVLPIASPLAIDDPEALALNPVGSGPYVIDEVVPEVSVTLTRNPDYWNPDAYDFDVVTFLVFDDDVAALNALKSGQIDATSLPIPLAAEAESQGFVVHTGTSGQVGTLIFLDREGAISAPIGDSRVRRAINMAFDREAIAESLHLGFGAISSQVLTADLPEYIEGGDDYYSYDPEGARELLAEAGYPDGFDLTILSGGAAAHFFINVADYEPLVVQALAEIGINVTYEQITDVGEFLGSVGNYPVVLFPAFPGQMVGALGSEVEPYLDANDIDPDLAALVRAIDYGTAAESAEASQAVGRLFLEQAWFAPFSKPQPVWASVPEVELDVAGGLPDLLTFRTTG